MKSRNTSLQASLPVVAMVVFVGFLILTLLARVYLADRDLALSRINATQADLAAEAGVHFALLQIQKWLNQKEGGPGFPLTEVEFNDQELLPRSWRKIGVKNESFFRIVEVKKIPLPDRHDTPLFDESGLLSVTTEGRCGGHFSRSQSVVSTTDLIRRFGVVNSLNEYYYGQPIQPWASHSGGLEPFTKANLSLFEEGKISIRGICHDPKLLVQMFQTGGSDPFKSAVPGMEAKANFGTLFYSRNGDSICEGPLYCQTPMIVDSHAFWGPVQTASVLFRRGNNQARLQINNGVIALPSSKRVQMAVGNVESEMVEGVVVDQDSFPKTAFLPPWRPNFPYLRQLAKKTGIYIDLEGKSWNRGEPANVDYHRGEHHVFSESYLTPTAKEYQRDEIAEPYIVLSTKTRFGGMNNLDSTALKGSKILFSETSVFIRGEVGGDLVIVTPRHIFLTGSVNPDGPFHLFLIPGEGVGLSTVDLESFVSGKKPGLPVVDAARSWYVKGVLYKPGAGWFGNWEAGTGSGTYVVPSDEAACQRVSVTIQGGCLEGNLNRWMYHAASRGISVKWDKDALDRLPVPARTANILRMKTTSQKR